MVSLCRSSRTETELRSPPSSPPLHLRVLSSPIILHSSSAGCNGRKADRRTGPLMVLSVLLPCGCESQPVMEPLTDWLSASSIPKVALLAIDQCPRPLLPPSLSPSTSPPAPLSVHCLIHHLPHFISRSPSAFSIHLSVHLSLLPSHQLVFVQSCTSLSM